MEITVETLKKCKESEDHVEFKEARDNFPYDGGSRPEPKKRRHCILGYVTALCNEKGGFLVFGMADRLPHQVTGTSLYTNSIGQLEADIYRDTRIRVKIYELYENEKRVLVVQVPPCPIGKVFRFEDVPLMRVGEELLPMSDEVHLSRIQEQEPDFSQQICEQLTLEHLDLKAIEILKQKYAKKQNNTHFLTLSTNQILSDLDLMVDNKLTYAALILLGKEEIIRKILPQSAVMLEYRNSDVQIPFDNRIEYHQPFYILIDELWKTINLRNGFFQVKEGPYIFDVPYFNEEVIRESINNAIAHRDYRIESEVVIKQYPQKVIIINSGGFPYGVTLDNLLTVPSTPRNRLLANVLSKTGIVERSGQGIDKIFLNTLSEGKDCPDYTNSDAFKVELILSTAINDRAFALFVDSIQGSLSDDEKLSVFDILTLVKIRDDVPVKELNKEILHKLLKNNIIERLGRTRGTFYVLSRDYYEFTGNLALYHNKTAWSYQQAFTVASDFLKREGKGKMKDFVQLFEGRLTRKQVRTIVASFVEERLFIQSGKGAGTIYKISADYQKRLERIDRAIPIGLMVLDKIEKGQKRVQKDGSDDDKCSDK